MRFFYTFSIHIYSFLIHIFSVFNPKAKLWINGRKDIFEKLRTAFSGFKNEEKLVWFHCASLGEFEQGRPLIEKFKVQHPDYKIFLTFFSPSGYEIRKNYKGADFVFYLPIDTPANAKQLIRIINPKAVFFIKYEFWFNYLNELKNENVPTYLVSGIFRKEHYFFKFYGTWFRKQLNCFSHFYLQTEESKQLLKSIGYNNITVCGDTRFDRVFEISKQVVSIPLIEKFKQNKNIFIAGSTWLEDEKVIANCKLILAPHEIDENHLRVLDKLFGNAKKIRYSQANEQNVTTADVLIIDNIGMLSSIYQYASIAYIGGGFGKGIHNILEAATFGKPVIFGPNYKKFSEANELIQLGGAFSVSTEENLKSILNSINNTEALSQISTISKNYVTSHSGACSVILSTITLSN
jgi:3-deoxy-D-manno-octulosonic-acid transferase